MTLNPLKFALSVRSDFSIGESSFQLGQIVDAAKAAGITHLALTDTMTVSAMPSFVDKCNKAEITPIIGVTVKVVDDATAKLKDRENRAYRLKVFPVSEAGMRAVFKLLSLGLSEEQFYYTARVELCQVLELEDCLVTTGDIHSLWHHPEHEDIFARLAKRFTGRLYPELVAIDSPLFDRLNTIAANQASALGYGCLITRPAFYQEGNADATDVLRSIATNTPVDSQWVARPYQRDLTIAGKTHAIVHWKALAQRVPGVSLKSALHAMTEFVTAASGYKFTKQKPCLPQMAPDEFAALMRKVAEGWKARFSRKVWGHVPTPDELEQQYKPRLAYEIGVLKRMGFAGYFLLVQDIVNWSKENGILVGPGRGSVGGSLVAYLMGITDIDPIRFGLLFERFINPDRIDLPDADLDFMSGRRHMVVDYISRKYGAENVCGIVNFATLGAAGALRDTARLHGLQPFEYACSKQMEKEHGVSLGLEDSAAAVPDIEKFKNNYPIIWNHATRIEGANKTLSQHAAGVVVAGEPVVNRGVISTRAGHPVVQWDKRSVEDFGLIKIDVLGLNTLDLIGLACDYIKERHHTEVDLLALPLDDDKVLSAFGKGNTTGVFQFDGGGMKKLLKEMAERDPLTFDDVCAATALFRPGPLDAGLCERYVWVKQGKQMPYYDHPKLEPILKETYGVMAYQEQVMMVTRELAGFTPGEADGVRKAIGKKDAAKMAEFKDKFIDGCVTHSAWDAASADRLWTAIEGYAAYSFNKSHSYEYTLISYLTMWLKVYYPAEFYAAAMTVIEDETKLASLVSDAQNNGLRVLPPDLNGSSSRIEIQGEDVLLAPFQAVKGISFGAASAITELREKVGGKFTWREAHIIPADGRKKEKHIEAGIAELDGEVQKQHLGRTKVNARVQEALALVGAMHSINGIGPAPMHPDRLRDRLALMPGFTVEVVKASRKLNSEHLAKIQITSLIEETRRCEGCSLKGEVHPLPRMGSAPSFMIVFDTPTGWEANAGKMMEGPQADAVRALLKDRHLAFADGYYTALVKSPKPKEQKMLANEQINGCSDYLKREIEILKPPVILALGSNAVRFFAPGLKGTPADLAGKAIYRQDFDATIVFGINPGMVFHDASKAALLELAFDKLAETLN